VLKEPNLAKEAGQGLLSIVSSYARGDLGSVASSAMGLFKKATSGGDTYERNMRTKTSPADVIMWSGSKDSQTSYVDLSFPDEPFFERVRHDSVATITPLMYMTSPEGQVCGLEQSCAPLQANYLPFRDIHGNILI